MLEAEQPTGVPITLHLPPGERSLPADAKAGLTATPKMLPPKHFYDSVGSDLFEQITDLPEYYPTRAEREILIGRGAEIAALCNAPELVELGSGAAEKALLLIEPMLAAGTLHAYTAVEVSQTALEESLGQIKALHPELAVAGHVADMTRHLGEIPEANARTVALLGGTLGNFAPEPRRALLAAMAKLAGPQGLLLLGFDLVKDPEVLVAAYDDAQGVTARFNLNVLEVINRELGGNFNPADFEHVAVWNDSDEWIEMRLRAKRAVEATLSELDLTVTFAEGEQLLTETSAKFTPERIAADLASAGLMADATLLDAAERFALVVAKPVSAG
jgi:L-histidine N-alpha-methyltransferase